ncbi:hypothetical protein ABT282_36195 [Streptomyces sp. NPDC000927]|uniref:hypothetical protein n=1 Tax=Streptomyces sp. NPDC000927 TaxID=3154371 RepID=UPI0033172B98
MEPPIQAVPATDDREVAMVWYEALREQGIEGIVAKRGGARYPSGRGWTKIRHADTVDAVVVGFTGPRRRVRRLALMVGDEGGPVRLSARLDPVLAARVSAVLVGVETGLVVEVLAGSGRHGTLTVTRMR